MKTWSLLALWALRWSALLRTGTPAKELGRALEIGLSQTATSLRGNTPERRELHPGQRYATTVNERAIG